MGIKISDMVNLTGSKLNDDSLLLIADLSGSTSDLQNRKLKVSTFNQIFSNNKSLGSLSSNNNFFGSEQDGDVSFLTSTNISSENNGEVVVKQYKSCSISLGATVTTSNPCRGLVIFCTGDLTVTGTLTMTAKGGGVGNKSTEFNYNIADTSLSFTTSSLGVQSWNFSPSGSVWYPRYRQNVPIKTAGSPGGPGTAGVFACGSGGSGAKGQWWCPAPTTSPFSWGPSPQPGCSGGGGGTGTIFAGGGGGGGQGGGYCSYNVEPGSSAVFEVGGSGGYGDTGYNPNPTPSPINPGYGGGGGGAGYSAGSGGGGSPTPATSGTSGAGGLLIIIVRGNVSITGTISSNGSNGGTGGGGANGGGGGGSGGGRIIIVYGGTYSNAGTVQANGGSAGSPGGAGSGGAGAVTIQKVDQ